MRLYVDINWVGHFFCLPLGLKKIAEFQSLILRVKWFRSLNCNSNINSSIIDLFVHDLLWDSACNLPKECESGCGLVIKE